MKTVNFKQTFKSTVLSKKYINEYTSLKNPTEWDNSDTYLPFNIYFSLTHSYIQVMINALCLKKMVVLKLSIFKYLYIIENYYNTMYKRIIRFRDIFKMW